MTDYQYKESGIEWLEEIPAHWEVERLGGMGVFSKGSGISKSDLTAEGQNVILYGDLYTKYDIKAVEIKNKIPEEIAKVSKELEYGDLLFTGSGETAEEIGKTVAFQGDNKTLAGGDLIIFKPQNHDSLFLSYALNSESSIFQKARAAKGDIVVHIYSKNLRNLYLSVPPLPEQKAIADYLDTACQKIDRVIAKKEQQIEKIEKLYKSEIYEKCTKGLNNTDFDISEIEYVNTYPKHWELKKLKRFTRKIDTGHTPDTSNPEYFKDGDIEWFSPESITDDIEVKKPKKLINRKALEDNQIKLYPANSVFFVGVGATAGKVGIIRKPSSCNQQINIIQTKEYLLKPEFLVYQIKILEKEIIKFAQYTTLPILNQSRTGLIDIVVPPIIEQEQIVEYLNDLAKQTNGLKEKLYSQIGKLKDYKKSLIHECITGKKQVFDGAINGAKEKALAAN